MSIIFDADKLYFDEGPYGISPGLNFDMAPTIYWDAYAASVVPITLDFSYANQQYIANEVLDIDITVEMELVENYAKFLDLLEMVPLKFRGEPDNFITWVGGRQFWVGEYANYFGTIYKCLVAHISGTFSTDLAAGYWTDNIGTVGNALRQFLDEAGLQVGSWIGYINDLVGMIDKYSVGDDYIQKLADLVGYTIIGDSTTSLDEKRRQLIQVIDWYKMKGTYATISYIGYLLNLNLNFWDLYTNNYSTFVQEPWFVGNSETENPGGLDATYYKSPHFGMEVILDTVYGTYPNDYLYSSGSFQDVFSYIELVRPVNTVPHYSVLLSGWCNESGVATTAPGNVMTATIGAWTFTKYYFDDGRNFNNPPQFFDFSRDSFLNSITRWKLGTGNKHVSPDTPAFAIASPVLGGTITGTRIYSDRTEYEFTVPAATVQAGISELGLFLGDNTTLEIAATFPDINKPAGVELRCLITVYR